MLIVVIHNEVKPFFNEYNGVAVNCGNQLQHPAAAGWQSRVWRLLRTVANEVANGGL